MAKNRVRDLITAAIETYTGKKVKDIKTFEDSVGALAVRTVLEFTTKRGKKKEDTIDWIIGAGTMYRIHNGDITTAAQLDEQLEEAQYDTWPPEDTGKVQSWEIF